ncbi:hypothetical protein GF069_14855 [Escherichia coli]|nr:hypothetical protein [Escherichia coli]
MSHFPSPRCVAINPPVNRLRPRVICYSCGYRFYHSVTRIAMGKTVEGKNAARVTQQNLSDYYQKTDIFAVRSPV